MNGPKVGLLMSFLADDRTSIQELRTAIKALTKQNSDIRLFIRYVVKETPLISFDKLRELLDDDVTFYAYRAEFFEPIPQSLNYLYEWAKLLNCVYLGVYSADDYYPPGGLDRLVALLEARQDATLAYGDFDPHREGSRVLEPSTSIWRMSTSKQIEFADGGLFNEYYERLADGNLYARLATKGPFINETLFKST